MALEDAVEQVASLAAELVAGADDAAASTWDGTTLRGVVAATSERAGEVVRMQSDLGDGPQLRAIGSGRALRVDSLADDVRWPIFAARVGELGVTSLICCDFTAVGSARGSFAVYATGPDALPAATEQVLPAFAGRVGAALAAAHKIEHLTHAVESRQLIGQATGILMERYKIPGDVAFQRLIDASQERHVKIREIALRMIDTGLDPERV